MHTSMRRETVLEELRQRHDILRSGRRQRVARLCKTTSLSGLAIASATGENQETVRQIKKAIASADSRTLEKLLHPENNRPGRRPVLTGDEEKLVSQRLIYAARRGFALDRPTLQRVLGRIEADGRNQQYKNQFPCASNIRRFRSRHRELTYRRSEYRAWPN